MGKFSRLTARKPVSPVRTAPTAPDMRTYNGAPAHSRDAKSELFLLGATNFVSEDTFYEDATARDNRFVALTRQVASEDPDWIMEFLPWLRRDANMRSASVVGAIEAGIAMGEGQERRALFGAVMQRPDEPGEALGYWMSKYGKPIPKWLKKALGDAIVHLYTEKSALKYDGQNQPIRFADVLELSQIAKGRFNPILAKWLIDRRHKRDWTSPEGLSVVQEREKVTKALAENRDEALKDADLAKAGMTWEALGGTGKMDAKAWEAMIPSMGYMALLRNLRNFDEQGVSDETATKVAGKLADPTEVARSRQLPMRFLSAYKAAPSDRWKHALGKALDESLNSIPVFDGETIVLVDVSGSMGSRFSQQGSLEYWEQAAMFGLAIAKRNPQATVFAFSDNVRVFPLTAGASSLNELSRFSKDYFEGRGTNTVAAINAARRAVPNAKRIIILTDEQYNGYGWGMTGTVDQALASFTGNVYTFNLVGYRGAQAASGPGRHYFTGLNDSGFKIMQMIEQARDGVWPWEIKGTAK